MHSIPHPLLLRPSRNPTTIVGARRKEEHCGTKSAHELTSNVKTQMMIICNIRFQAHTDGIRRWSRKTEVLVMNTESTTTSLIWIRNWYQQQGLTSHPLKRIYRIQNISSGWNGRIDWRRC